MVVNASIRHNGASADRAAHSNCMDITEKRERLAESQARLRRLSTWGLGGLAVALVLLGVGGWWLTGEASWLHVCLWFALFVLLRALYNQFCLLNPRRDPIETEKKLTANRPGGANARKVTLWNGWIMVVASPFIAMIALGSGIEDYGPSGALFGLAGPCFLSQESSRFAGAALHAKVGGEVWLVKRRGAEVLLAGRCLLRW